MTTRDVGVWRSQEEQVIAAVQNHKSVDSSCTRHASEALK
jgi:hypothetical protein